MNTINSNNNINTSMFHNVSLHDSNPTITFDIVTTKYFDGRSGGSSGTLIEDSSKQLHSSISLQQLLQINPNATIVSLFDNSTFKVSKSKQNISTLYHALKGEYKAIYIKVGRNNDPTINDITCISEDLFTKYLSNTLALPGTTHGSIIFASPYQIYHLDERTGEDYCADLQKLFTDPGFRHTAALND